MSASATHATLNDIKQYALDFDLPWHTIDCEIEGEIVQYPAGTVIFQDGDEASYFSVVLEGNMEIYRTEKSQEIHITNFTPGMSGGETPLLSGTTRYGNARALTDIKLFCIPTEEFWCMMAEAPELRKAILANAAMRSYEIKLAHTQRERLLSLGMLSAGLAHELNNPASAAKRSADKLVRVLYEFDIHSTAILKPFIFKPDVIAQEDFPFAEIIAQRNVSGVELDALAKSDLEEEMIAWLEDLGVENAWDIAPSFVYVGFTKQFLEKFFQKLLPQYVLPSIYWIHQETEMYLLVDEQQKSTQRISELVGAIKSYSYMDNSGGTAKQAIDIHQGLKDTLLILNFKVKQKGAKILKLFNDELPQVEGVGGELNQVWTNLIDNAIDALPEQGGVIEICTDIDKYNPNMITVQIKDNGMGIPSEVMDKIFDPFFTTKPIGKGTGIGLQVVERIIVQQHKGLIRVSSMPGETVFRVSLPKILA